MAFVFIAYVGFACVRVLLHFYTVLECNRTSIVNAEFNSVVEKTFGDAYRDTDSYGDDNGHNTRRIFTMSFFCQQLMIILKEQSAIYLDK